MPPPRGSFDLVVVGAGICGLSHAAAAAARGLRVALLERDDAARLASARNFGLLTQLYDDGALAGRRARRSRELYAEWARRGALPARPSRSLQLAQSAQQLSVLEAFAAASRARHGALGALGAPAAGDGAAGGGAAGGAGAGGSVVPRASLLTAAEAALLAPGLRTRGAGAVRGALLIEGDALVEPRVLCASLPRFLERDCGVALLRRTSAVGLRAAAPGGGAGGVLVRTAAGEELRAAQAVVCAGADAASLLPGVLAAHAADLRLCKLQMMRLRLPRGAPGPGPGPLPLPVTSGLTMRRYPAFALWAPAEHAAMMARGGDPEGADAAAEALGIHVIARPAAALQRSAFGDAAEGGLGGWRLGAPPPPLAEDDVVLGDSHQYAPLGAEAGPADGEAVGAGAGAGSGPPAASPFDEACDERVTDEILRVAGGMLRGVGALLRQRAGRAGAGGAGGAGGDSDDDARGGDEPARLLSQWSGVYLQHSRGLLNVTLSAGDAARDPLLAGLEGRVHVVTGLGGAGMTISPALGEENVARWF
jgi:glycine/D-amino acid oxidase-like deaminating enzyme